MEQTILSIGREFGSAGHEIAQKLADYYQLPLYDHNLLDEIAAAKAWTAWSCRDTTRCAGTGFSTATCGAWTALPPTIWRSFSLIFSGRRPNPESPLWWVGRCSETVLRPYKGLISIFVLGDMDKKVARIMDLYHMNRKETEEFIKEKDKRRKQYHNSHCDLKWGDSRNYDLCINSSRLGVEETMRILVQYIDARRKNQ